MVATAQDFESTRISANFSHVVREFQTDRDFSIAAIAHMVPNTVHFIPALAKLGTFQLLLPKPKSVSRPEFKTLTNSMQVPISPQTPKLDFKVSQLALLYLRVSTSRQATRGGEPEGYSLPAQREACTRKALELGAAVEQEFVDAGASARSADRIGLQALLGRLADTSQPPVSFVIVHKLDRLARDRADDVQLLMAIHQAGAQLVSVSEQIDETPSGMLLHGIMATIAEFYSRNLSAEAKKGIAQKAMRGGTIGYAPTGYLNTTARVVGDDGASCEVKTVIPDPERAPHIAWAFTTYATGETSLSDLTVQLAARGLTTRDSRATGRALS